MEQAQRKNDIIRKLQDEILLIQGFKPADAGSNGIGLGVVESAFPNGLFPKAAIHEFIVAKPEHAAACSGFLGVILSHLMRNEAACIWISKSRNLFPASLKAFGIEPDQMIFIDVENEKDILWVMEEALKCKGLSAVVAEVRELSFAQSRRLQLALEKSKVTGFVLRTNADRIATTACVARWLITPVESEQFDDLPGIGFPCWNVELLRVRNGNPGNWKMSWANGIFREIKDTPIEHQQHRKLG